MKETISPEERLLYLAGGAEPPASPRDRSENPYRRFYTKDRSARDLARPPAKEKEKKESMDTTCVDFRHALNMELVEKREGYVEVGMDVLPGYMNRIGSVHGGLLYTLADSACGAAVLTYGNKAATLNGNIDYLKPGMNCKRLTAKAQVIKHGSQVSVVDCRIFNEKDELLATARLTFFDLGMPAQYTPEEKYQHK